MIQPADMTPLIESTVIYITNEFGQEIGFDVSFTYYKGCVDEVENTPSSV